MRSFDIRDRFRCVLCYAVAAAALAGTPAWAITYEYDALGRVTKVTYDDGSYIQYQYDAAGNRTVVTGTKN
jgi:YD repeat-containing protein